MKKLFSPSADRNKQPILECLKNIFQPTEKVLEIASGTGQHAAFFCENLNIRHWQTSEPNEQCHDSIIAHIDPHLIDKLSPPLLLNVSDKSSWPKEKYGYIFCANMLHIAPFQASVDLFHHGIDCLTESGRVILYGPFFEKGVPTTSSNEMFHENLKERNNSWGIRAKEDLINIAKKVNMSLEARIEMPANNLILIFKKVKNRP